MIESVDKPYHGKERGYTDEELSDLIKNTKGAIHDANQRLTLVKESIEERGITSTESDTELESATAIRNYFVELFETLLNEEKRRKDAGQQ